MLVDRVMLIGCLGHLEPVMAALPELVQLHCQLECEAYHPAAADPMLVAISEAAQLASAAMDITAVATLLQQLSSVNSAQDLQSTAVSTALDQACSNDPLPGTCSRLLLMQQHCNESASEQTSSSTSRALS